MLSKPNSRPLLKILLVDEWGGAADVQMAHDIAAAGAQVYLQLQSKLKMPLPKRIVQLPVAPLSPAALTESVGRAVQSQCPDVILPLSEQALHRLWDDSPDWLHRVHPIVEPAMRAYYRDRHLMGSLMRSRGVLIPKTHRLREGTADEILSQLDSLGLPVVVKGAGGDGGAQVRVVETIEDAFEAVKNLFRETGTFPALQEYIDGPTYQVGGVFDNGRPVHLLAGQKTQMMPPRTGPAIALRSCNEPELIEASIRVFAALGYSGIAGADFVRGADGQFRFLEVNPRVWGSWDFARVLGLDLFGSWFAQLRGEHLPTSTVFPLNRSWAKMPEYLFALPSTRSRILRRALHPLAIRSWYWRNPHVLLHQLRRAYWTFRR